MKQIFFLLALLALTGCKDEYSGFYLIDVQARDVVVDEAIENYYDAICDSMGYTGVNFSGERWSDEDTIYWYVATAYRFPTDREDVAYAVEAQGRTPQEAAELLINQLQCVSLPGEKF